VTDDGVLAIRTFAPSNSCAMPSAAPTSTVSNTCINQATILNASFVDNVGVDHADGHGYAGFGIGCNFLGDTIQVFGDGGIVEEFLGALDFLAELFAKFLLAIQRKEIDALADISVADGVKILVGMGGFELRSGLGSDYGS
jgi:hypothetical protein